MEGVEAVSLDFIRDQRLDLLEQLPKHEQHTLHLFENITSNNAELAGLGWQCLEEYNSLRSNVLSMLSKLDILEQQLVTQATS